MRRFAVVALLAFQTTGCGGSSSETPPPLEPDPARLLAPRNGETPDSAEPGAEGSAAPDTDPEAPIPAISGPRSPTPSSTAAGAPAPSTAPTRRGRTPESSSTWGAGSPPPALAPLPER